MAERQFRIAWVAALALACVPAQAAEFVPYGEARAALEAKPAVAETGSITPEELRALQEKNEAPVLLDARSKLEFERERLAGARLPHEEEYYRNLELFRQQIVKETPNAVASLSRSLSGLEKGTPVVTYCNRNCGISKTLKHQLEDLGFTNVRWLVGGIDDWRDRGFPLDKN